MDAGLLLVVEIVLYLVNLKFATWVVPSFKTSMNWRQEFAHALFVFQT